MFAALLVSVAVELMQRPDRRRVDVALLIATLAIPVLDQILYPGGDGAVWFEALLWAAIAAHAFLMVRVVDHVRPVPRFLPRLFLVLMLASWTLTAYSISLYQNVQDPFRAGVLVIFLATEGYALGAMVQGIVKGHGIRRRRLRIAASAVATIVFVMALVALEQVAPVRGLRIALTDLAMPLVGLLFLLAFAPPAQVQRAWQNEQLRQFVDATARQPLERRPDAHSRLLMENAAQLLGSPAASLQVRGHDGAWHRYHLGDEMPTVPTEVWQKKEELVSRTKARPSQARFLQEIGAEYLVVLHDAPDDVETVLLVPVSRPPILLEQDMHALDLFLRQVCRAWAQYGTWHKQEHLHVRVLEAERQAAREASRLKSEFLATTSHEIRTPLNAVLGMATLLQATQLSPQQEDYVHKIEASGKHLLAMLSDILDFSRIEAGRLEMELDVVALRTCVEDALDIVAPTAQKKGIELSYLMDGDVPEGILGDATRLRQVLVNLIGNAVKFTDTGEVEVKVHADRKGEHADLEFDVRDTGPGIPEEDRERIFDLFTRSGSYLRRHHGGSGLGLAISSGIVQAAGGEITVESTSGKGSTFRFTWPAKIVEPPERMPWQDHTTLLSGRRVLVVEDIEGHQRALQHHMEAWHLQVDVTSDPDQAIQWVQERTYDLIMMDERISGATTVATMRERVGPGLPDIILLSSDPSHAGQYAARVPKPVKPSTLFDALVAVLVQRQPAKQAPPFDPAMGRRMPLRILVAEDSATNQLVIKSMLERLGYAPELVADGAEAVQGAERRDFDLVLMDLQMPTMDGLEAAKRILAQKDLRIVALTAHAGVEQRRACEEAGMKDYLTKPLSLPDLTKVLERAWESRKLR